MRNQFFKIFLLFIAILKINLVYSSNSCDDPSGADCTWYRNCLNAAHNCTQSGYEYALSYGEKFCLMFSNNVEKFSADGQEWVGNTRKCLQVELAKKLKDSGDDLTCKQIREFAFSSHAPCYIKPLGQPGICDLEFSQWWNIFKIIWTQFIPFYSGQFLESIQGAFEVGVGCLTRSSDTILANDATKKGGISTV